MTDGSVRIGAVETAVHADFPSFSPENTIEIEAETIITVAELPPIVRGGGIDSESFVRVRAHLLTAKLTKLTLKDDVVNTVILRGRIFCDKELRTGRTHVR